MSISKNPAFNLKAVLQETNIAADTLRAWERRYGLPMPERTEGGIAFIRNMISRRLNGCWRGKQRDSRSRAQWICGMKRSHPRSTRLLVLPLRL